MSDIRALLKAKREEARVSHPFAAYSAAGQLRCTACNVVVKHASAWQGHLGSKSHRNNVALLKEQQLKKSQQVVEERDGFETERDEVEDVKHPPPSGHPLVNAPPPTLNEPAVVPQRSAIDSEWEAFQRDVVHVPDRQEVYERATLIAEPVIASSIPEGFPTQAEVSSETPTKIEGEARRKEQEERELIMDRLLEEERAQEDADLKVTVMKQRLAALKKKREAAKAQSKYRNG